MRFFGVFLAGVGSVLSLGLPNEAPLRISREDKNHEKDCQRIGGDLYRALKKYRAEKKNDKA